MDEEDPVLWSSHMDIVYLGLCHTFIYPNKTVKDRNHSIFYLNPGLSYRIMIHDPKFYISVRKRGIYPRILLQYKSGQNIQAGNYELHEISLTEHHLLNRPEQPCEEGEGEEDYDFLQCVKTSQARSVGCRPPWDSWSPHTIPLCQTMEQLQHYEMLDTKYMILEKKLIVNQTGCLVPCKYKVRRPLIGHNPSRYCALIG